MRTSLLITCALFFTSFAAAQERNEFSERRLPGDSPPSHYSPASVSRAGSESAAETREYVFPERRGRSAVSQAAWTAETELPSHEARAAPANDKSRPSIPLAPRGSHATTTSPRAKSTNAPQVVGTVGTSLVIVLGVFFLFAWLLRKHLPASAAPLPKEAVEMLGRAPLLGRQQLSLLRVGNKLVLLAVSPLGGAEALTEITDQAEVDRLIGLCYSARSGSVAANFRQVLTEVGSEPASGFLGASERPRRRTAP